MSRGERNTGWSGFFMVFAVFCAVVMLLAQQGQNLVSEGSGSFQVLRIYEGLNRWAVPGLFMLWGMEALGGGKPGMKGSVLGLVLPCFCMLVFWGALYAVAAQLLGGGGLSLRAVWRALCSAARGNTYFHLWLLYPLMGMYLIHPVIHRFTASAGRGEIRYFLALCFVFAALLPVLGVFYPGNPVVELMERLQIHLVLGYVGYYVAGWYLRHYTIGSIPEFIIYILGIVGVVLTLFGERVFGGSRALWQGYTAPGVAMTAVALCTLFRYVLGISEERSRRRSILALGNYAFGMYLFHQIWVLVFGRFDISVVTFSPVISIPLFAVLFCLLSAPFAWLLYLIPGAGRWLT